MKLKIWMPLLVAGFAIHQHSEAQSLPSDTTNFQHTKTITTSRDSSALKNVKNTTNEFHQDGKDIISYPSDTQRVADNPAVDEMYNYFMHYRNDPSAVPPIIFLNFYRRYYA